MCAMFEGDKREARPRDGPSPHRRSRHATSVRFRMIDRKSSHKGKTSAFCSSGTAFDISPVPKHRPGNARETEGEQGARAEFGTVAPASRATAAGSGERLARPRPSCGVAEGVLTARRPRRRARRLDRQDPRGAAIPGRESPVLSHPEHWAEDQRVSVLEFFSWPSIFALSVVLAALALIGIAALVPTSRDPEHASLDPAGALLSVAGISGVVFAIIEGPVLGWGLPVGRGGLRRARPGGLRALGAAHQEANCRPEALSVATLRRGHPLDDDEPRGNLRALLRSVAVFAADPWRLAISPSASKSR